jgi:hypothetical protein
MLTANAYAAPCVTQTPSGRYQLAGTIPAGLAFDYQDEGDLLAAIQCGPGIARRIAERNGRTFVTRSYATRREACYAIAQWNGTTFIDTDGSAYHGDA